MTIIDRNQLIAQIHTQRRTFHENAVTRNLPVPVESPPRAQASKPVAPIRPPETVMQGLAAAQPRLVSESVDTMERGFRRTQVFRQSDGRNFIRNEEVSVTERGMQRTVTQENPSGSRTRFDETLERQPNGSFQRIVRHINESGALETKVEENQNGIDKFILSGGSYTALDTPYDTSRGNYFDGTV